MTTVELLRRLVLDSPDGYQSAVGPVLAAMGFEGFEYVRVGGRRLDAMIARETKRADLAGRLVSEIGGVVERIDGRDEPPRWVWRWDAPLDPVPPPKVTFNIGGKVLAEAVVKHQLRCCARR